MGNTIRDAIGNPPIPCHIVLGKSAAIDLSTKIRKRFDDGGFWEDWYVSYIVDGETCYLTFVRDHDIDNNVNKVSFVLLQRGLCLRLQIQRTETDFLRINCTHVPPAQPTITWTKTNRIVDACGSVMDTKVYLHGNGNQGSFLVLECKKNSSSDGDDDDEANVVTVAHYFANSSRTAFNRLNGSDIGFSVVAKIRVVNGKLDITVEGPEQHPASSLFYMFDEVIRTGIWKPTMCLHFDNIRRGRMFWQSGSEDSESIAIDGSNFNGNLS